MRPSRIAQLGLGVWERYEGRLALVVVNAWIGELLLTHILQTCSTPARMRYFLPAVFQHISVAELPGWVALPMLVASKSTHDGYVVNE